MSDAAKDLEYLQNNPVSFVENILGDKLEEYQKNKIINKVRDYDKVSIKACHAVGKTFTLARIILWFTSVFMNSIVITTAPTARQVRLLLWAEIRAAYKNAKKVIPEGLGGKMNETEWKIAEKWYAIGFSPSKSGDSGSGQGSDSSFQGFHAKYILVVFDEATGIHPQIWKMVKGLLTSGKVVKFVGIANPTSKATEFYNTFFKADFHNVTINCFDSPNLIANGITNKKKLIKELNRLKKLSKEKVLKELAKYKQPNDFLINTKWVISEALELGIDHPLFVSKALGEFPDEDENTLITLSDFDNAVTRECVLEGDEKIYMGIDPARMGADSTIITVMMGNKFILHKKYRKRNGEQVANEALDCIIKVGGFVDIIGVDGIGIGASTLDFLNALKRKGKIAKKTQIIDVQFGASAERDIVDKSKNKSKKDEKEKTKRRYANLKAKIFDLLAKDIRSNISFNYEDCPYSFLNSDIINQIQKEAILVKYNFDNETMAIQGKKEFKKENPSIGSPDNIDGAAICNYMRHKPRNLTNIGALRPSGSSLMRDFTNG